MIRSELRPLLWIAGAFLGAAFGYECSVRYRGVGGARYVVTIESLNGSPVREVRYSCLPSPNAADEFVQHATANTALKDICEESAELIGSRSFTISGITTTRTSPFRVAADEHTYLKWVLIGVELSDGSRWFTVEQVPDPRGGPKPMTCRLDQGRQIRPPQPAGSR